VPKPVTDVITEKTYVTTEPEIEIRKPATLSQALTEPAVAVVKPKTKVRKEIETKTRRRAWPRAAAAPNRSTWHWSVSSWARLFSQPMYVRQRLIVVIASVLMASFVA